MTQVRQLLARAPGRQQVARAVHDLLIPPAMAATPGLIADGFGNWTTVGPAEGDLGVAFHLQVTPDLPGASRSGTWHLTVVPDDIVVKTPNSWITPQLRPQVYALASAVQARLPWRKVQAALRQLAAAGQADRLAALVDGLDDVHRQIRNGYAHTQAALAAADGDPSAARTWQMLGEHDHHDPAAMDRAAATLLGCAHDRAVPQR